MDYDRLLAAAMHEARHALVGFKLGLTVEHVCLGGHGDHRYGGVTTLTGTEAIPVEVWIAAALAGAMDDPWPALSGACDRDWIGALKQRWLALAQGRPAAHVQWRAVEQEGRLLAREWLVHPKVGLIVKRFARILAAKEVLEGEALHAALAAAIDPAGKGVHYA